MSKLNDAINITHELNIEELEDLNEIVVNAINNRKKAKRVELFCVSDGYVTYRWFTLDERELAIAYAIDKFRENIAEQKRLTYCKMEISSELIPEDEVQSYLDYRGE